MKIKIIQDWYEENSKIFKYRILNLEPGILCLVGCNGAGKTTLLNQVKKHCEANDIKCIHFDNYKDGGRDAMSRNMFYGHTDSFIMDFMSSEGERISNNVGRLAGLLGSTVRNLEKGTKLFVLLDAIDSGYSIDNIIELKRDLLDLVKQDCEQRGIELYVLISANEYEICEGNECMNVVTGKKFSNPTYNCFKKHVLQTRKLKDIRYGVEESLS